MIQVCHFFNLKSLRPFRPRMRLMISVPTDIPNFEADFMQYITCSKKAPTKTHQSINQVKRPYREMFQQDLDKFNVTVLP